MKLACLLCWVIPCAALAGTTLTIDGTATSQPSTWTVDQLKQQPAIPTTQIAYQTHDGSSHHSTCVSLLDVLHAAGVPIQIKMTPKADPRTKHRALRMIVTARATDGYIVVFSLGELLPDIGHRSVWLALDQDGEPFAGNDAPVKLISPDDIKPARWVHGVQELSVDQAAPSK
jgi:hypothetical protein